MPYEAGQACLPARSVRATTTSVVSPASKYATNFTRHTRFAIRSPTPPEPMIYRTRNKSHNFTCSHLGLAWDLAGVVASKARLTERAIGGRPFKTAPTTWGE